MEYLQHFGLSRDPFGDDPSAGFYLATPRHRDVERRVRRGITQGRAVTVLTGAVGAGKTGLVRRLLEDLEEEVYEASVLVPVPGASDGLWVLDRFARQLGVEEPARERLALLGQIYERLAIAREDGRRGVLIIDEAQVLASRESLEALRGLLNLEYEERRLLSLVLVGLPELDDVLAGDAALAQRVDVRVRLDGLDPEEARAYVSHRIQVAGGDPRIVSPGAMEALARLARGMPGRLNALADNALYEAFLAKRRRIEPADVEGAARDLEPAGHAAGANVAAAQATPMPPAARAATAPAAAAPHAAQSELSAELYHTGPELRKFDSVFDGVLLDDEPGPSPADPTVVTPSDLGLGDTDLSLAASPELDPEPPRPGAPERTQILVGGGFSFDGEDALVSEVGEAEPPGAAERTQFLGASDLDLTADLSDGDLDPVFEGFAGDADFEVELAPAEDAPKDDELDVAFEDLLDKR